MRTRSNAGFVALVATLVGAAACNGDPPVEQGELDAAVTRPRDAGTDVTWVEVTLPDGASTVVPVGPEAGPRMDASTVDATVDAGGTVIEDGAVIPPGWTRTDGGFLAPDGFFLAVDSGILPLGEPLGRARPDSMYGLDTLALDDARVFFVSTSFMAKVIVSFPKTGGGFPTQLAPGQRTGELALADGFAYWVDSPSGEIRRVAILGGTPEVVGAIPAAMIPRSPRVRGRTMYFRSEQDGALYSVAIERTDGSSPAPVQLAAGAQRDFNAAAGAFFFVGDAAVGTLDPLATGGARTIAWTGGARITADATNCYVVDMGNAAANQLGTLWAFPRTALATGDASARRALAMGVGERPVAMVVDGSNVYVLNMGTAAHEASLVRVPVGGGAPVTLLTGPGTPLGLGTDDTFLYYTWAGQLYRLRK